MLKLTNLSVIQLGQKFNWLFLSIEAGFAGVLVEHYNGEKVWRKWIKLYLDKAGLPASDEDKWYVHRI